MVDEKTPEAVAEKVADTAAAAAQDGDEQPEEPLRERVLGPQSYIFDSPLKMFFLAAVVPLVAFLLVPRVMWLVSNPKLPDIFVRPSTADGMARVGLPEGSQLACRNLNVGQPDLWNRSTETHRDRQVQALAYCEDAKLIPNHGVAVIACDPGRHRWNTVMGLLQDPDPRGALWVWDYSEDTPTPNLIDVRGMPDNADFHPLGIHVQDDQGELTLYAVNHRTELSTIEVFDLVPGTGDKGWVAQYKRMLTHPQVTHSPNSVAMYDEHLLLVTNDHLFPSRPPPLDYLKYFYSQMFGPQIGAAVAEVVAKPVVSRLLSKVETLLGLPFAFVSVVDLSAPPPHTTGKIIARGMAFANGIAVSPYGSTIAVAETTRPAIRLYTPEFEPAMYSSNTNRLIKSLNLVDTISAPMLVDNLDFTKSLWNFTANMDKTFNGTDRFDGAKLVASGHPHAMKLLSFAQNPANVDKQSGSWAVTVEPAGPPPRGSKMDLPNWRAFQDGVKLPAAKRVRFQHRRWLFKTLYQAQKGFVKEQGFGVASASTALWDPTPKGKGALIVTGLYARGVLSCRAAALE